MAVKWVRGVEYGTASDLAARFKVSIWTIYKWRDPTEWDNPADALAKVRISGRDYSSVVEAAAIDLAKRDETRGAPRLLDASAA